MRMTANENKMTARERLASLFDDGTFQEIHSEGVITGKGTVAGRVVYAFAQDYSINAGAMTESMAEKICEVMDMSLRDMAPLIGINESAGAHIQEGVRSRHWQNRLHQYRRRGRRRPIYQIGYPRYRSAEPCADCRESPRYSPQ